jgi:hypothetical protein
VVDVPQRYRVRVTDEATVVERGERVRVWFLHLHDGWVRAADHPEADTEEARSEHRDAHCPPGTIWQRHVELKLAPGALLLSRVTRPLIERLDTLHYLTKERRGIRRHVEETWFEVIGNYRLKKAQPPASFDEAREKHLSERARKSRKV